MRQREFDDLAFEIEIQMRGIGKGHRRRQKPYMSEIDAHCASLEVARWLREHYEITRRAESYAQYPAATPWGTHKL